MIIQPSQGVMIRDGAFVRFRCHLPGPGTALPEAPDFAGMYLNRQEFDLLNKYVPVVDDKRRAYKDLAAYLDHRDRFFGPEAAYRRFAEESDDELEQTEFKAGKKTIKLRSLIEFNQHPEAQNVFYRWIRQAYRAKFSEPIDVPRLIRAGMAPKLIVAIDKVKLSYGKVFRYGGLNPRPKKIGPRYVLGTLSEHAVGLATDIETHANLQIKAANWKFVEQLAGKVVDRSKSRWQKEPKALWQDIKEVNDLFVKKLAEKVQSVEAERAKVAHAQQVEPGAKKSSALPVKPVPSAVDEVLGTHQDLKVCQGGFFSLEWELVEQLHACGFLWGATFRDIDLHHFELEAGA